jgi:hypothetical protein
VEGGGVVGCAGRGGGGGGVVGGVDGGAGGFEVEGRDPSGGGPAGGTFDIGETLGVRTEPDRRLCRNFHGSR